MDQALIKAVMYEWNQAHENTKNGLMKLFLENDGDFDCQLDWLRFLVDSFGISENYVFQPPAGSFEH